MSFQTKEIKNGRKGTGAIPRFVSKGFRRESHGCGFETPSRLENRGNVENVNDEKSSILSSSEGIMHVSLSHGIRIDITVDNSIRLISGAGEIVISISNKGKTSAVKHPIGLVEQIENFVKIVSKDPHEENGFTRFANMTANGITFANSMWKEVFVLDTIGTRQTEASLEKLARDNTSCVFFSKSKYGSACNEEVFHIFQKASVKKCVNSETNVVTINDYRIWQMKDGLVTVARMSLPFKMRVSPLNRSITLSTPFVYCTASSRAVAHLFVRCRDQSMHSDGKNFVVRYNGNSAGFDKHDYLNVY